MDNTKRLEECIKELKEAINFFHEYVPTKTAERAIDTALSLAIQVRDGKLVEPISEIEIKSVIQIRYYKLMTPDITEKDAEIVAGVLSRALVGKLSTPRLTERNDNAKV